ncbi:MAG TPA: aspartyl protease family protein [Caulobacteraceae bacterium]|nr:aspartyl protease family protein [Caulobacteraceae bacterium]
MVVRALDRRRFGAALLGLGLVAPALARAEIVQVGGDASRLMNLPDPEAPAPYTPPADLKSIIDIYKRMTCPVEVEGAGPFPFVADTGANQSVISAELAAKLALKVGDAQALNGVAGVQITPTVGAKVRVGSRPVRDVTLFVLPADAIGGPGMVGLDQLDGARLTLDFRREELSLDTGPSLPGLGDEIDLKAQRRDGQLTLVDADVAGIKVTAFLDSGAQDTIGNMALRQLALIRYPTTIWSQLPILSVTGQTVAANFADLPGLRIGGLSLPSWPVAFADLHIFRLWNLVDRPAIVIGVDVLSRFETVCLDFRHNEVRFRLPSRT